MPFSALTKELAKLEDPKKLPSEKQATLGELMAHARSPAEVAYRILPTIGTESRATMAIAYLAIMQSGETSVEQIVAEKIKLFDLTFNSPDQQCNIDHLPKVTKNSVKEEISILIQVGLLERTPSGRIQRPSRK